ncbi:MAG: DUF86 domain-containing protein [Candidatus Omnitrophica bacterium]|nr:DUF86 domain-containing protein [Candidatus Omnitrophota bacterium]MCM8803382.1 DUF86 domain-containing protein [Candidatus Omnitrophota bacterium]
MVPSGIDKEKLFIQIERLKEHIVKIKNLKKAKISENFLIPALERNLHLAIEDCLNIGNHIISGLSLKRPDTYKEIFKNLKEANIISEGIYKEMVKLVSLRNRLVHLYWEVKDYEVLKVIENLKIFDKYVEEILKYLKDKKLI